MTKQKVIKQLQKRETEIWEVLENNLSEKNLKNVQELIYISEELTALDGQ